MAWKEGIDVGILVGLAEQSRVSQRPGPASKDSKKWDQIEAQYNATAAPSHPNLYITKAELRERYYSLRSKSKESRYTLEEKEETYRSGHQLNSPLFAFL